MREGRGDAVSQQGKVGGVVGTGGQRVERVEASAPDGALVRHQVLGGVLLTERELRCV